MALSLCWLVFEVHMCLTWLLYCCNDQLLLVLRILAKDAQTLMLSKCLLEFFPMLSIERNFSSLFCLVLKMFLLE